MYTVENYMEFEKEVENNDAVVFYFSHEKCSVCKVMLPKIEKMLEKSFPKVKMVYSNTLHAPDVAAQNRIFTVPSVLIYFAGKQYFQFSRNFSIDEIKEAIERPYNMLF